MAERLLTVARTSANLATRSAATRHAARRDPEPVHATAGRLVTPRVLQPRLDVGAADDPFEREAERTARAVTTGGSGPGISILGGAPLAGRLLRVAQRAVGKSEPTTKKDDDERKARKLGSGFDGPEVAPQGTEAAVRTMSAGGSPLPMMVRSIFEPRFGFDFSDVRVHTGGDAGGAALSLGARAFTVGDHIFFGPGQYQPTSRAGQHLIAHELTHTIQQKPGAARAARLLAAPRSVQRFLEGPREWLADKLRNWLTRDFPPWDLITLIIGWDPIRDVAVRGSTKDWIRAAMKLAPDGEALFAKLDGEGKVDAIASWWDTEVAKLNLTYASIVALVREAISRVEVISDALNPVGAWNNKFKPLFVPVVTRVWNFIRAVGAKVFQVVKDLVLKAVGDWAKRQRGYPLLTMVLGRDPVTGEEVRPTLEGVIFAVLDLVPGGDKIKENLQRARTVQKAATWFKGEVTKLNLTWAGIRALFSRAWDAFRVADLLRPVVLFERMWGIFGPTVMRLIAFLIAVGKKVLEFIFEGAMILAGPIGVQIVGIVRKIGATFNKIVEDPIAFVGHLIDAVKKGVRQFGANIWEHLKTGLIEWLTGTLGGAGLVLPRVWDLRGILDLVLQILGITWPKIRAKLVAVLGERTVSMLETAFTFIRTLVTEGPAAAWREIVAAIGNLWDTVIGGIKDWAVTRIVTAAITKLATMFNPAGAVIQAIIAIYNTVAFFIERIRQILAFVEAVVDSIANIAHGRIAAAANYVERAMARTIPVILGFLARLIGLGDVSGAVKRVITAIQARVDRAIDSVIAWVVRQARSLFAGRDAASAGAAGTSVTPPEATFSDDEETHRISARMEGGVLVATISSETKHLDEFLDLAQQSGKFNAATKAAQLAEARAAITALKAAFRKLSDPSESAGLAANRAAAQAAENRVASALRALLSGVDIKAFDERYKLEGLVGTYGSMPRQSGDRLTPDHQPQAALVKHVADLQYTDPATNTRKLLFAGRYLRTITSGHATGAVAINLHENRHKLGLTFGRPVPGDVITRINAVVAPGGGFDAAALEQKRRQVIGHVRTQLGREVDRMVTVASSPASYPDVVQFAGGDKKAKPLIDKITAQVVAGEARVRETNLDGWAA